MDLRKEILSISTRSDPLQFCLLLLQLLEKFLVLPASSLSMFYVVSRKFPRSPPQLSYIWVFGPKLGDSNTTRLPEVGKKVLAPAQLLFFCKILACFFFLRDLGDVYSCLFC